MVNSTDPAYLKTNQYRNSINLSVRVFLHQNYSTNSNNWHQWIFKQFDLPKNARVLELGTGPGYFWQENVSAVEPSWLIYLSDLSEGMLEEAQEALEAKNSLSYTVIDAQNISFPESFFDAVIANHMLYHVPNIHQALKEIRRVLKPAGCFFAATNGLNHLSEIRSWKTKYFHQTAESIWTNLAERFGLENGGSQLEQWFSEI
jgi:ubiquinone/menaquinone biosynthesis C-methylase UbiE